MKDLLKNRYIILAIFFIILGVIIVLKLIDLQIVHGKELEEISEKRVLKERTVVAPRGNILDRNGIPVTSNRQGFNVDIINTEIKNKELNEMLLRIFNIFEKNGDKYKNTLKQYLTINPVSFNNKTGEQVIAWQTGELLGVKHKNVMEFPEKVFEYIRDTLFKIDGTYTDDEAYKIMVLRYEILKNKWTFDIGGTVRLAEDVDLKTTAELEERQHEFPGVTTSIVPIREYIDAEPYAHVLGFVRQISAEQYEKLKEEEYGSNDIIGQTGVELAAERYLRGKNGQSRIEVDTKGRLTDELSGVPAIPGNNVILTIDTKLQKVAMESLENCIEDIRESGKGGSRNHGDANAGAAVAVDVNSGQVLVMASYPSYDPSIFLADVSDTESQKKILELYNPMNTGKPALNRAIQGQYAPGSTYKPITAIAGLEEGIITPDTVIECTGRKIIGNMEFWCLEYRMGMGAHGPLKLKKALETSCNLFFHELGYRTGIDNLEKWAKYFGLGEYTGLDIPGESKGVRAGRESKKRIYDDEWWPADTAQTAIGQFNNVFTPIQLVRYISALANGGKLYKPYTIKTILKYDGSIVNKTIPEYDKIPVSSKTIDAVKQGMISVVHSVEGTAAEVFKDFPVTVAGKTGTAETGKEAEHSSNALFVCYAPAENPEIAVAVVVENGVWGSYTAPVARDILEEYFSLKNRYGNDESTVMEEAVFTR